MSATPDGHPPRRALTPRERTVLLAIGQRLTNSEIAQTLMVSKHTVECHVASLFAKFGVRHRLDLIALAETDVEAAPPASLVGTSGLMWREITRLRGQFQERPQDSGAHKWLAQAAGVVFERYRLPSLETADRLIRGAAARHGLDAVDVAHALLTAPRPESGGRWFPHRRHRREPELSFLDGTARNPARVLGAALDTSRACAGESQGDLQLTATGRPGLDLVAHRGFTDEFVARFAHVDGRSTACALALSTRQPVSVRDVAESAIFAPITREALTAERVRAVHSTPILAYGRCLGVVSTHAPRPGRVPSRITQIELARIADETGDWLVWQRHTARLDALEDLHFRATTRPHH
ncbi:ANTAR domain-containing protein [Amycolatopsis sacchari]|uniref:ANTAR domain-containing protein n=1 Tax=Amycolatopsis sacchari TaxID=115433 RepID=A0A1I4DUZ8_9PSEU|nr:LuxR C-terminal-related transcriptional regulator [Amycolatopsis sacchari]SFK97205.1 ANTAR domain-containing protein [Amycolatopsis sacchari]